MPVDKVAAHAKFAGRSPGLPRRVPVRIRLLVATPYSAQLGRRQDTRLKAPRNYHPWAVRRASESADLPTPSASAGQGPVQADRWRALAHRKDFNFEAAAARAGPRWESIELEAPAHWLKVIILELL